MMVLSYEICLMVGWIGYLRNRHVHIKYITIKRKCLQLELLKFAVWERMRD